MVRRRSIPARKVINRTFPTFNLSSKPISAGDWLTWTPSIGISNQEQLHIDQVDRNAFRYIPKPGGGIDSVALDRNSRNSSVRLDTPIEIFGFSWHNSFNLTDVFHDYPEERVITDVSDTSKKVTRVFKQTYKTDFDWQTSFNLPSMLQGTWNLTPSVQIQKVDGAAGLMVRTERTGNRFVSQPLRPAFTLGISPKLYHIFPGFGPLAGIRHSIEPQISFSYSPSANVSDDFLAAMGRTRVGFLGGLKQNLVTLTLATTLEGKLKNPKDTLPGSQSQKVKLLALNFTSLSYDFERARVTGKTGLTTQHEEITVRSDLLPGLDFGTGYSLFQGDPLSDSAVFKPYRESMRATLHLDSKSGFIQSLGRLLGFKSTGNEPPVGGATQAAGSTLPVTPSSFVAGQPIAGGIGRTPLSIPSGQGWRVDLSYSAQRTRPATGSNVVEIDPTAICLPYESDPTAFETCVRQNSGTATEGNLNNPTTLGGAYYRTPPTSSVQGTISFHVTDNWAAQWNTTYDFVSARISRARSCSCSARCTTGIAVFSFTRAPNGNFAFNFHIALKAAARPQVRLPDSRLSAQAERDSAQLRHPGP